MAFLAVSLTACSQTDTGQAEATTPEPTPTAAPESKGVVSITIATELTTADYDKVVAELSASGEWMNDWTYHAIGTIQPKGFFTMGVYPSQSALDHRRGKLKEALTKLGITSPTPQVHEVQNIIVGAQPAGKPATAFVASFAQTNMSAEVYTNVISELEAKGAGAPSGRMYHVAYRTADGIQVIDVWESEAQFKAFGDVLMPILASKGVTAAPTMYPLYNTVIVQ